MSFKTRRRIKTALLYAEALAVFILMFATLWMGMALF
jgi:hypothetical protein